MLRSRDALLASLLLVGCAASLEVQITPTHGEISLGESKFFMCDVGGVAKHIDWFGPSGDRIEPNRPDLTVTRNDESSSTLTIYKAGTEDAGTYKCVATNGDQQGEATVQVKMFQRLTFTNAPSPQEFNEGDNANIVCDVVSSPPPTVFWKYKGTKIQMEKDVRFKVLGNNHLQIRGIKKTDEGLYMCEARLMARGEIDLRAINVVVNVLPTIRIWQTEVNATADAEHPAVLTCAVDGYPEPMVTWTRNGVKLEDEVKYGFNDDGSEMTIMDVTKLDEGEYTCIAKNKAGENEKELSLRVFVKPKITYIVNKTTSEMEEETLTCEATGDPTPTISWSYGEHFFTEGEQASWTRPEQHKSLDGNVVVRSDARVSSLTLKYVKYTDAGQYLCTARSTIGEDKQAAYLEVRYAPKIHGTVAVYTWEGNPVNISCEVRAYPSDVSIVWLRDGLQLPNSNSTNVKIFRSPTSSYLQVTPESENDFGSYNCTASNEMGTESKEFLLIQAEVPSAPFIDEVRPFSTTALIQFEEPESTGGVPVLKYRTQWRVEGRGSWVTRIHEVQDGFGNELTITGLKPDTSYEVKLSAANGKGEGESSSAELFKTAPVQGNPNPPKLEGSLQATGNSLKVSWIAQDDGGSPILHYLVRYKPIQGSEWKPEIRMPSGSEHVVLRGLEWDTEYSVYVVAENQKGKSQPATMSFRTSSKPEAIPDLGEEGVLPMGTMLWAGILVVVFVLLLLAVDVTCYFVNKCGLIMCLCGKPGTGTKGHNLEEGKAAFVKDESKEPIVEVRTEDECTANHNAAGPIEPNETTPLTKPELVASLALDTPSSVATNSDTATATNDPGQESPSSETTTLTCSLSTLANEPSPTPLAAPAPTPESNAAPPAPVISSTAVEAKMAPLLEERGYKTQEEQERITPPRTPEQPRPQKPGTPIPPKRKHSPKLAAMNAKNSPPVSPLAVSSTSSPSTPDMKKPAPNPPVTRLPPQPNPNPDYNPAPDSSSPSFAAFDTVKPTESSADNNIPTTKPVRGVPSDDTGAAEDPDASSLLPITQIVSAVSDEVPTPAPDLYDVTPADTELKNANLELELTNGTGRHPRPLSDLISLESPPADPSQPSGDGTDLPPSGPVVEASETLVKTAPPVNDEKIYADEKSKLEEGDLPHPLISAAHNNVIQTNATESKV
uniref:Neural cell adhesion molecule 1b n=1 Tax=Nothobranchius kuhntae TaxID=321403 RepID=A0A1A8I9U3_NOTKU